jgi:predicted outer membrane repeat protein
VRRSTFTGNTASRGGAISNHGELTIINSEITGNTGRVDGGGIYTCCGGTTTLKKTEVTGNTPNNIVVVP